MAQITTADIAKLRKVTAAGLADCKQALTESDGDFDKAIEFLRKKGQKIASKRQDREANEGCVLSGITKDGKTACVVAVNCETDFVAKNADFVQFTQSILDKALEILPATADELKAQSINGSTIADLLTDQMGKIGEKIDLGCYEKVSGEQCFAYTHQGNRLASIVSFNGKVNDTQIGKDIAMQIAAMNPVSIDKDDCPQSIIDKEIEIAKDQLKNDPKNANKPEEMLKKIAMGKLNKFFNESTLMNQEFVKDAKITISQHLQAAQKDLVVTGFKRFGLSN